MSARSWSFRGAGRRFLVLSMTRFVLLHGGHDFSWRAWHLEPSIVGGLIIVLGLYSYGVLSLRQARPIVGLESWRVASFLAGSLLLFLALVSPLDAGAERLFSLHMLQHIVLSTLAPPFVVLGLPAAVLRRLLSWQPLSRVVAVLTHPFVAPLLFIVNMWLWHIPSVYDAAITYQAVHITMHLAFMGTGLAFWWPIIQPLPERGRLGDSGRLLYLFFTGFPMGLLALILLSANSVLYEHYRHIKPLWGISALNDQQVGGVIMGVLGEIASFVAFTLLFFRIMAAEETPTSATKSPRA